MAGCDSVLWDDPSPPHTDSSQNNLSLEILGDTYSVTGTEPRLTYLFPVIYYWIIEEANKALYLIISQMCYTSAQFLCFKMPWQANFHQRKGNGYNDENKIRKFQNTCVLHGWGGWMGAQRCGSLGQGYTTGFRRRKPWYSTSHRWQTSNLSLTRERLPCV